MKDTIIKGAGNSRLLKSVPNVLTLYPTYESFVQALATSGLPIDLLGLQAAGVEQMGTDLNKATLLSDAAETAIWGNAANRTPDAALKQLRSLITTAQGTAGAKGYVSIGSYTGNGGVGASGPTTVNTPFAPKAIFLFHVSYNTSGGYVSFTIFVKGMNRFWSSVGSSYPRELSVSWGSNYVRWYALGTTTDAVSQYNSSGQLYNYIVVG